MLLRATLMALAVAGTTAQNVPSIEAVGDNVIVSAPMGDVSFSLGVGKERTITLSDLVARIVKLETTVESQAATIVELKSSSETLKTTVKSQGATIVELKAGSSTVNLTPAGSADGATPATITAVRDDSSGIGLTIASVQPKFEDQGESSHAEMFIDSTGNVGLGVANPLDRLSVSGNIRATGEITVNNVNLLEQLRETRASLSSLRNTVLGSAKHVYKSCNHAYTNLTANGQPLKSGVYTVQPRGLLSSDTWQVYCDMRSDGGWLRIGRNTSLTFDNEFRTIYDANLVSQDDMDVVAGHVAGLGAFNDFEVDCNVDFAMQADNVANDHRVFYISIDNLKAGHFASSQINEMRMGLGQDHTFLTNRDAESCKKQNDCCDNLNAAGSTPDAAVYAACQNPFTDRNADRPTDPYYAGPRVDATFPGSCTAIMCQSKSPINPPDAGNAHSCGKEGKPGRGKTIENIVFTRLEFRPSTTQCGPWKDANGNLVQCNRHRFNLQGNHYYIYLK